MSVLDVMEARRSKPGQEDQSAGDPRQHRPLRGGFSQPTATLFGAAAGIATLVLGTVVGQLVFENAYGPFGTFGPWGELPAIVGTLAAYGSGAALGLAVFVSTRWLGQRSRVAFLIFVSVAATVAWVVYPQRLQAPQINERFTCKGVTFGFYPPHTSDATTVTYCVGLQEPVPAARQLCQEIVASGGSFGGREVALGYAPTQYRFDQSGELRLCLSVMNGMTATVTPDLGIEVVPATTHVELDQEVLRFTLRVQPGASGAIKFGVRDKYGTSGLDTLFGPTIQATGSGWRIAPHRSWPRTSTP